MRDTHLSIKGLKVKAFWNSLPFWPFCIMTTFTFDILFYFMCFSASTDVKLWMQDFYSWLGNFVLLHWFYTSKRAQYFFFLSINMHPFSSLHSFSFHSSSPNSLPPPLPHPILVPGSGLHQYICGSDCTTVLKNNSPLSPCKCMCVYNAANNSFIISWPQ